MEIVGHFQLSVLLQYARALDILDVNDRIGSEKLQSCNRIRA